jgi:hypothetical protein
MGSYNDLLTDFASRTKANLNLIEEHAEHGSAYEVTQLINSFLGLFVFAQQKGRMPRTIQLSDDSRLTSNDMRHLRNAVSHFHLEPQAIGGLLSGFDVWDLHMRSNNKKGIVKGDESWKRRTLKLADLKCIVDQVHQHITETN